MNQKTLAIAVIAIVVVAVIAVGVYWALQAHEKPTGIEGATSLTFSVDITGGEQEGTYTYMAKNIGTSDMMIRVEIPLGGIEVVYIVNGAQQKAWANEGSGWVDLSDTFSDQWDVWDETWNGYTDNLSTWTTGDWTYTEADESTVKIYDITVNPSLEDSLFEAET